MASNPGVRNDPGGELADRALRGLRHSIDYDHCKVVPADCDRSPGPKLTLISSSKKVKKKARKGKKITLKFKDTSNNRGGKNARAKVKVR